jgi:serine/threonine protein phosphatase PrpC
MHLKAESETRKNNISKYFKPNEDYCLYDADKGIFIITDGVSRDPFDGIYPNPSPSAEVAKLLTETVFTHISTNISNSEDYYNLLFEAYKKGNELIKENNEKNNDSLFLPGAVSLAAIVKNSVLYFCYLGDVSLKKINSKETIQLTRSQTEKFRRYSKSFARSFVRSEICNNIEHPLSYGVFTGEDKALSFLSFHKCDLSLGDKFHFATDGLDCIYDFENAKNISSFTAEQILSKAEYFENKFSDSINSDDKTIIIVTVLQ